MLRPVIATSKHSPLEGGRDPELPFQKVALNQLPVLTIVNVHQASQTEDGTLQPPSSLYLVPNLYKYHVGVPLLVTCSRLVILTTSQARPRQQRSRSSLWRKNPPGNVGIAAVMLMLTVMVMPPSMCSTPILKSQRLEKSNIGRITRDLMNRVRDVA